MFPQERRNRIIEILKENKSLSVRELCNQLEASEATIRRDLTWLEERGMLQRTHGGAVIGEEKSITEELSFYQKETEKQEEKIRIAKYAYESLKPNDTLFLDAGTTTLEMAKLIGESNIPLVVITNSVMASQYIARNESVKLYTLGGEMRTRTLATVGEITLNNIAQFNTKKAFLGTNGISIEKGLTTPDKTEAEIKKALMKQAAEVIILADHSNFQQVTLCKFGSISMVDFIITDMGLPNHVVEAFSQYDIQLVKV